MKLIVLFTPFTAYFKALGRLYSKSLRVLFLKTPNLDGTLDDFQMQRGIVWSLLAEHWRLGKTIAVMVVSVLAGVLALALQYLNLVLTIVFLVAAPLWIPFSLIYEVLEYRRLKKNYKADVDALQASLRKPK